MNLKAIITRLTGQAQRATAEPKTWAAELAQAKPEPKPEPDRNPKATGARIDATKTIGAVCNMPAAGFFDPLPPIEYELPKFDDQQALENALNIIAQRQALNRLLGAKRKDDQ